MSSQYDSTIFERAGNNFVLSQRFRHFCERFLGTFRLAGQMLSINAVLGALPRPIAYLLLFFYYLLLALLFFLIVKQLCHKRIHQYEDLELTDFVYSKQDLLRGINRDYAFLIIFSMFSFVFFFALWNENLAKDFINFYGIIALCLIFFYKGDTSGTHNQ